MYALFHQKLCLLFVALIVQYHKGEILNFDALVIVGGILMFGDLVIVVYYYKGGILIFDSLIVVMKVEF